MASENVQTAERAFAALAEGGVGAMLPFVHEDFEMTTPPDLASEPGVYEGHAGLRRWWDSFYEAMDEVRVDANRIEDLGDELVVSFRITARGRSTGLEVVQEAAGLCTVEDGKAKRIRFFATRDDAVKAAGLPQ